MTHPVRASRPARARCACAPVGSLRGRPPRTSVAPGGCDPRGSRCATRPSLTRLTCAGAVTPSSSSTPSRSRRRAPGEGRPRRARGTPWRCPRTRMRQEVGQSAVVGQDQQPLGVHVEASRPERSAPATPPGRARSCAPGGPRPSSRRRRACSRGSRPGLGGWRQASRRRRSPAGLGVDAIAELGDGGRRWSRALRRSDLARAPRAVAGARQRLLQSLALVQLRHLGGVEATPPSRRRARCAVSTGGMNSSIGGRSSSVASPMRSRKSSVVP